MSDIEIVRVSSGREAADILENPRNTQIITKPEVDLSALLGKVRYLVSDFDGTIIPGGSLWNKTDQRLPEEKREAIIRRFKLYRRQQATSGLGTPVNLTSHICFALDIYVEVGFPRAELHSIAEQLRFRPGFRRLHGLMENVAVVSVGFSETIEHMLRHHNLPCDVAGTCLEFDENGCACGYSSGQVVVDTTKGHAVIKFMERCERKPDFHELLIIGDTINDRAMMFSSAVCALFVDPDGVVLRRGTDYIHRMWDDLSFILVHNSFEPLVELIEEARQL